MPYSADSKVGEILQTHPAAKGVITKYGVGIMLLQPQTSAMSLSEVGRHLRWPQEKLDSLVAEVNAL